MAKTRIKTTPTRMQKEALMASAAVTTTTNNVTEHVFKKRLSVLKSSSVTTAKEAMPSLQSTIIVQTPKRTNSISSATSTISHTSEGGGVSGGVGGGSRSCNESPPPTSSNTPTKSNGPTMAELTENAIKTLNAGLLAKTNALALKNRKVYMITEKSDDANGKGNVIGSGIAGINGATSGQKRKMYLIMEEKESGRNTNHSEKLMKTENTNVSKKLTLFTDTTNGQLPQKFEKILPEILNCIQAKKSGSPALVVPPLDVTVNGKNDLTNNELNVKTIVTEVNTKTQLKTETNERLPLTLPPKKNRTKIITTQIIPVNSTTQAIYQQHNTSLNLHQQQQSVSNGSDNWLPTASPVACDYVVSNNNVNSYGKFEKSSVTPVIVKATTLITTNGNSSSGSSINANGLKSKDNGNVAINTVNQMHKNINLSTDFLFLMKMLPKLESIEEPHKNYVKNCIEEIINQYASANPSIEP
ncbi:hypothetical protein DOY81_002880 [Sarcophaga bullata]|nr:hypothetical protein DOY81_002880 [Sarcophaga bullata]